MTTEPDASASASAASAADAEVQLSRTLSVFFFQWLHKTSASQNVDPSSVERGRVSRLYADFVRQLSKIAKEEPGASYAPDATFGPGAREGLVMAALRRGKKLRTKKYDDGAVICTFARPDGSFATGTERRTETERLLRRRREAAADKGGVRMAETCATVPPGPVLPTNEDVRVIFEMTLPMESDGSHTMVVGLNRVTLGGSHRRHFSVATKVPRRFYDRCSFELAFRAKYSSTYRVHVKFHFQDITGGKKGKRFVIHRHVLLRAGDAKLYDIVKAQAPYVKRRRRPDKIPKKEDVVPPPKSEKPKGKGNDGPAVLKGLLPYKIPRHVRELVLAREMEGALVSPFPSPSPSNAPPAPFHKNLPLPPDVTFGIELELSTSKNYNKEQIVAVLTEGAGVCVATDNIDHYSSRIHDVSPPNTWKLVYDGSLRCSRSMPDCNCFELVSPVLRGDHGVDSLDHVGQVLEALNALEIKVNYSMGFHVHVGVDPSDVPSLVALCQNFIKYEDVMDTFMPLSRRSNSDHSKKFFKSNKEAVGAVATNKERHKKLESCTTLRQLVDMMNPPDRNDNKKRRYYKLNLTNLITERQSTVEFRQHSGTANFSKVSAWIHFCVSMVHNANHNHIDSFSARNTPDEQWDALFDPKRGGPLRDPALGKYYAERRRELVPAPPRASVDLAAAYPAFWQHLLWTSELQAYEDVQLFDLEDVALECSGHRFRLLVAGLAEGRPSVLRHDVVRCMWNNRTYLGRVAEIHQSDVFLEFDRAFGNRFDHGVDRVERVRFTFGRTTFRTSHAGVAGAVENMGSVMLIPTLSHVRERREANRNNPHLMARSINDAQRQSPQFKWASRFLNEEQKQAVVQIAKGALRPMPYIIFGPPGTGKTTTLVEAVYQLAKLHTYEKKNVQKKLNILLVAPSNDATDILVQKLAAYFPPSEMVRLLAYTRTVDQAPPDIRSHCQEGDDPQKMLSRISRAQITVATVNMASRLWCYGVERTHFDVLCVDEAGHATEPEIIAVASSMLDYGKDVPGQLILAGDPLQLGPIVTSDVCKKFGMGKSYMERLVMDCPAYKSRRARSHEYPPELVTFLVNNYRSHPDILKLPNEMFYDNRLVPRGDEFATHSMVKWEHLPKKGFPIVFHAINGENLQEAKSPSWFNPQEAIEVVDYVQRLVKRSKPAIDPKDIGIITPYARQVEKIRLVLEAKNIADVKVGSVETFQGQERQVIIISTVRSENELLSHDLKYNLGFVANRKRFNVATTRAKALLIVVGNPRVLETDKENWLPLLRFCHENGAWRGEAWEEGTAEEEEENEEDFEAEVDENEWNATVQESQGFINREE